MLKYRMNRPTYWLSYVIFMTGVTILAYLEKLNGGMELMMVLVGVPRLHDIGRSGWFVAAAIVAEIGIVFGALFAGASTEALEIIGGTVFFAVAALGIWLGIVPGNPHPNKWGEPPKPGIRLNAIMGSRGRQSSNS